MQVASERVAHVNELKPGTSIDDKYMVEAMLGSGGMCTVYLAKDQHLGRKLAIKVLHNACSGAESSERLLREARALCNLVHKNIVRLYHGGFLPGEVPYLAMEFVEGETLREVLQREKRLRGDRAVSLALQICDGMEYAHGLQIIHRDLKPENVILSKEGNDLVARIVDFGLCKLLTGSSSATLTETGMLVGTVRYMDPELILGRPCTFGSDIYSFGCVFFEMLTGEAPFVSQNQTDLIAMHLNEPFPKLQSPGNQVPEALEELILKCTAKTHEGRYASFAEVREQLQKLDLGQMEKSFQPLRAADSDRQKSRHTFSVVAKIIACLVAFLILGDFSFLAFTDAGNASLALWIQSSLPPKDAVRALSGYVSILLGHGRTMGAKKAVSASTGSSHYKSWTAVRRRELLSAYVEDYKKANRNEEAFEMSLRLLADLLDIVRHLDRKVPSGDGGELAAMIASGDIRGLATSGYHGKLRSDTEAEQMLESLSQALLKTKLDDKSWKQIATVFDMHDLGISSDYPPDPAWTGVLRLEAALRQRQNYTDSERLQEMVRLCVYTATTLSKSPENYNTAEQYFLRMWKLCKKYDLKADLDWYSPRIGLFYLKIGRLDLAQKYADLPRTTHPLGGSDLIVSEELKRRCAEHRGEVVHKDLNSNR